MEEKKEINDVIILELNESRKWRYPSQAIQRVDPVSSSSQQ
jgi:hypothetical protein